LVEITEIPDINPNPDDDGSGGIPDRESLQDAIARHHKGEATKGFQTDNPWGLKQAARGNGLDPIWNPSESAREGDHIGGAPDSPPTPGDIKDAARRGSKNEHNDEGDDNDNGGGADQPGLGSKGSIVHPERINPNPLESDAAGKGYFARLYNGQAPEHGADFAQLAGHSYGMNPVEVKGINPQPEPPKDPHALLSLQKAQGAAIQEQNGQPRIHATGHGATGSPGAISAAGPGLHVTSVVKNPSEGLVSPTLKLQPVRFKGIQ
jgi:hypothetical protein